MVKRRHIEVGKQSEEIQIRGIVVADAHRQPLKAVGSEEVHPRRKKHLIVRSFLRQQRDPQQKYGCKRQQSKHK